MGRAELVVGPIFRRPPPGATNAAHAHERGLILANALPLPVTIDDQTVNMPATGAMAGDPRRPPEDRPYPSSALPQLGPTPARPYHQLGPLTRDDQPVNMPATGAMAGDPTRPPQDRPYPSSISCLARLRDTDQRDIAPCCPSQLRSERRMNKKKIR